MSQSAFSEAHCSMCALNRWNSALLGSVDAAGSTTIRLASTRVASAPSPAISLAYASLAGSGQRRIAELTLDRVEPIGRPLRDRRNVVVLNAASWSSP